MSDLKGKTIVVTGAGQGLFDEHSKFFQIFQYYFAYIVLLFFQENVVRNIVKRPHSALISNRINLINVKPF